MATPDHKARARPPNPLGGTSTPNLGRPSRSLDTVGTSRQHIELRLATINTVMNDIALLVIESGEARRAQSRGEPMRSGVWPLPMLCAENLVCAIHLLQHYAESLSHEPGVEPSRPVIAPRRTT